MKLIEQSFELIGECPATKEDSYDRIETAGRICYQSAKKGEPEKFVKGLIRSGHTAMIEHSNIVYRTVNKLKAPRTIANDMKSSLGSKYLDIAIEKDRVYVGGNWRAWAECNYEFPYNQLYKIPEFLTSFPEMELVTDTNEIPNKLKRISVLFKTSRAVTHEMVRHRPCSFAQESQRYCAYRDELEFIIPAHYLNIEPNIQRQTTKDVQVQQKFISWKQALVSIESLYQEFLRNGEQPQQARHILPNACSTQIVITTDIPHWWWLFKLRCAKDADPNMQLAMKPIESVFKKNGWVM